MTTSTKNFLPYGKQCIDDDDIAAVTQVLRSDWLTTGPAVDEFENALARSCQAPHAVACANGTAALHLTALALGLNNTDCVIVPTMTFLATANAIRFVGAEVQFADVDPATGLIRLEDAQRAMESAGNRITAIYVVHLNGQSVNMQEIYGFAQQHGLRVVEDAAHAIGTDLLLDAGQHAPVGSCRYADMTIFSMHPVKTITMGEGGAVTTRNAELNKKLRALRSHGMTRDPAEFQQRDLGFSRDGSANAWYYEMPEVGFNYRESDINCALGLSQLKKLAQFKIKRAELRALYNKLLQPLAPKIRPVPAVPWSDSCWHLYPVHIDFSALGIERQQLVEILKQAGIGTQVHYLPVHMQPYYRRRYGELSLPNAKRYYDSVLSLPFYPTLTTEDVARVIHELTRVVNR